MGVVGNEERPARELTITDELAVLRLLLRLQVVAQDLIEALQAYASRFFFVVFANTRSTPDAMDDVGVSSFV